MNNTKKKTKYLKNQPKGNIFNLKKARFYAAQLD